MSTPARTSTGGNIGAYSLVFDHDEVVQLLKAAVEREGSQVAYAKRHGLNVCFVPEGLFRPDDHCPVNSVAILCMCNTDPLRAVQQQIGAMSSRVSPLV